MNKKQAVLMLTNLQGDVDAPGDFSVDVAIIRNNRRVGAYAFEVHYGLDTHLDLVGVEDVDFGGEPQFLGDTTGDTWSDAVSRFRIVGAINLENELRNLTLCRLNFQMNASSSDVTNIWLEATDDMESLQDVDGTSIPVTFDSRLACPVPSWARDRDRDGLDDDWETDDRALLQDIGLGYMNRWLRDSDGDGLMDGQEGLPADPERMSSGVLALTHPRMYDTDGDGFSDGMEVLILMTDPLDPNDPPADDPAYADMDGDGLPAWLDEDDHNPDQDGNGYPDGYEVQYGKNPRIADSRPALGDVRGTGRANNVDAIALFNYAIGNIGAPRMMENADVKADGIIDNIDALVLFNWALGNVLTIPFMPEE